MRVREFPSLLWLALLLGLPAPAASAPELIASTPPIHSLVAAVSGEQAQPHLLVPGGQSPHTFSLAPSDARVLAHADAVFTAGGSADDFLERPLATLAGDARVVRMAEADGARRLPARTSERWHAEDGHEHDGGDDGHGHDGPSHETEIDPHLWLDPRNAIAFTQAVGEALAELDPAHAERYHARAERQVERLRALDARLRERLRPVADRPYLVFHDAYQYFEARYDLAATGSVAIDPERPPGARHLSELRARITQGGIGCLFTEPQFEPRIAQVVAEDLDLRLSTLDPLGAALEPGPELYFELLEGLADSLRDCLAPA